MNKRVWEIEDIKRLKLEDLTELLLVSLFVLLPFFHQTLNWGIVFISIAILTESFRKRRFLELRTDWFLPALFGYFLFSTSLFGGSWSHVERNLFLLGIPLLFANLPPGAIDRNQRNIYFAFICGCVSSLVICFARAFYLSFSFVQGNLLFHPQIKQASEYSFLESSVMGGNHFFSIDLSFFLHPTYLAIFVVYAQYLIFQVFDQSSRPVKLFLIFAYCFFVVSLFFLSSKAAILSFLIIVCIKLLSIQISFRLKAVGVVVFLLGSIIFVTTNPRLAVFLRDLQAGLRINPEAQYGHDLRLLSWDAAIAIFKENPYLGVGEGNKKTALAEVYEQKGYKVPAQLKLNSHNQFLDFAVGGGVLALILFLVGIFHVCGKAIRDKNQDFFIFLVLFVFNAMFENLLSRFSGVLFFSLFVSLFMRFGENKPYRNLDTVNRNKSHV